MGLQMEQFYSPDRGASKDASTVFLPDIWHFLLFSCKVASNGDRYFGHLSRTILATVFRSLASELKTRFCCESTREEILVVFTQKAKLANKDYLFDPCLPIASE